MATVPLSGTNIRLLSGVPFSNDYKNTRWFDSKTDQTSYFNSKPVVHSMIEANFQRIEGKHFIAVDKSIDDLWSTNYLMFQNAQYNNKWFYGFVTTLEYKQKNVTWVHFQIDVFQTWKFDMDFKPSFVIREHNPLWNADGSPVINTLDEGLNYGNEYDTVSIEKYVPYKDNYFLVIVAKQTMHGGSADTPEITPVLNALPQPLSYYVHPFKLNGSIPSVSLDGTSVNISPILDVLKSLYKQTDAVNNIVSIYITEHIGNNISFNEGSDTLDFSMGSFDHVTIQDDAESFNTLYVKNLNIYGKTLKSFMNKYDSYKDVSESKLLMYPYTTLILDDFKGNRVEFKNEYIGSQNLVLTIRGSLGTSNKVAYSIEDYSVDGLSGTDLQALSLEKSLINANPNDVPIITDMLSAYLQGNRNSIENQKNSIMWNGLMSGIGNTIGGVASGVSGNVAGLASSATNIVQGGGNAVLQLQAIEAKQQDINNIPPQISKMGSNTAFDYGNNYSGVYIIKKQIKSEYRKKLTDFFKMYGYKINEVKVPNFHTRQSWNFVQTLSCIIIGNFNNEDLQELKAIFDNGITFWHTDDIGNYSLGNEVI